MNGELVDLLRKVSFIQHSLNDVLGLAVRAGHNTRGLEHVIARLERETLVMRTTMRRQDEAETRATAALAASEPAEPESTPN